MSARSAGFFMDLFNQEIINLLPYDGEVLYHAMIMSHEQSQHYFHQLINTIAWRNDETFIYGRHIITKRKVAWYGDKNYSYTYSNTTKEALPWTKELLELKAIAEKISGATYNSCLLNLYHDGNEGMAWHSDDEKEMATGFPIASLSLGAGRKFSFKHKVSKETVSILLENGSLLLMKDETQIHWLHSLPKTKRIIHPRINLTFRTLITG